MDRRGESRHRETADERLDRLIREDQRMRERRSPNPAVRSTRAGEVQRSGGEQMLAVEDREAMTLLGLSPEQREWLVQAAESMRTGGEAPRQLAVVPLQREERREHGKAVLERQWISERRVKEVLEMVNVEKKAKEG